MSKAGGPAIDAGEWWEWCFVGHAVQRVETSKNMQKMQDTQNSQQNAGSFRFVWHWTQGENAGHIVLLGTE
jgi:hypothetical protein